MLTIVLAGKLGNSVTTTTGSKALNRGMTSYPLPCGESVMSPKAHGTCLAPVQKPLRWQVDWDTADRICCFNRHYAEHSGYWEGRCIPSLHLKSTLSPSPLFLCSCFFLSHALYFHICLSDTAAISHLFYRSGC